MSKRVARVQDALFKAGVEARVVEMPNSTHTAQDAADAIGCAVDQIAKSLVFQGEESGKLLLVIASGPNRVSETVVATALGEAVAMADPKSVREGTGFPVGGVPPIGHAATLPTFIDEALLRHAEIWAAAGTPNSVFPVSPTELQRITGGQVLAVSG
ncbi:MAG TPA: YbaK/EbsC family protein [Dehalococcoidia bacterium]|nr:YbaK/EbsC family protein [Dehalococcoidia bacterium]